MKVEWWYDDASYYLDETRAYLARLTVRDDGSAQLITDGETLEFESEEDASIWLLDEEYAHLDNLVEDLREKGLPVDPRLQARVTAPATDSRDLVIDWGAASSPTATDPVLRVPTPASPGPTEPTGGTRS